MAVIACGCGNLIQPDANFRLPPWCPRCGADLKPGASPPAAAAEAAATDAGKTAVAVAAPPAVVTVPIQDPLSRVYRHEGCGSETVVSGDDFVLLECPFRPVASTFCCGCRQFVPLDAVKWVDSDERVSAYRKRVAASVPFWRKVYLAVFGNAYEGAVNLRLDRKGRPLQPSPSEISPE